MPNGVEEILLKALQQISAQAGSSFAQIDPADTLQAIERNAEGVLKEVTRLQGEALVDRLAQNLTLRYELDAAARLQERTAETYRVMAATMIREGTKIEKTLPFLVESGNAYKQSAERAQFESERLRDLGSAANDRLLEDRAALSRIADRRGLDPGTQLRFSGVLNDLADTVRIRSLEKGDLQARELHLMRLQQGVPTTVVRASIEDSNSAARASVIATAAVARAVVSGDPGSLPEIIVQERQRALDARAEASSTSSLASLEFSSSRKRLENEAAIQRAISVPARLFLFKLGETPTLGSPNIPGLNEFETQVGVNLRLIMGQKGRGPGARARRAMRP